MPSPSVKPWSPRADRRKFSFEYSMNPNLSPSDLTELMKIRQESDRAKDIHRVHIERTRTDIGEMLRERHLWENSQPQISSTQFEKKMKARYPYIFQNSPLLFKLVLEDDPHRVIANVDIILGNISKARQDNMTPTQCSRNVDRDLSELYYHKS